MKRNLSNPVVSVGFGIISLPVTPNIGCRSFLKYHSGPDVKVSPWSVTTHKHPLQEDGYNCGVLVLKAAESYFKNSIPDFAHDSKKCHEYRKELGDMLLQLNDDDKLSYFCVYCNGRASPRGSNIWVECEACERWCHRDCVSDDPKDFHLCHHCPA